MTATDHTDDITRRADKLYAARTGLAETKRSMRRFGIGEIVQFLNDPQHSLTMDEHRSLHPQLRGDYRRLKAQGSVAELPTLAAGSAGGHQFAPVRRRQREHSSVPG